MKPLNLALGAARFWVLAMISGIKGKVHDLHPSEWWKWNERSWIIFTHFKEAKEKRTMGLRVKVARNYAKRIIHRTGWHLKREVESPIEKKILKVFHWHRELSWGREFNALHGNCPSLQIKRSLSLWSMQKVCSCWTVAKTKVVPQQQSQTKEDNFPR